MSRNDKSILLFIGENCAESSAIASAGHQETGKRMILAASQKFTGGCRTACLSVWLSQERDHSQGEENMQVPLEVSFRGVERTHAMERLIDEQAAKLEHLCDHIVSIRVSVEKPQEHQSSGNPFRVRAIARIPPGHELVAARDPVERDLHDPLDKVIRETFHALGRQVKEVNERQKREMKRHPHQETQAVVSKLFKDEGYGFILTPEGREIYFHRNSVLHRDFERLVLGAGVRYHEEAGEKGPQASTIEIVDKPAGRIARADGLERP